jgi:hypothetical protein
MTVEGLKIVFDWTAVILLFLTFAAGVGVLITGNIINERQQQQLRQFDKDLTGAKTEVGKQQERAANADARVAGLEKEAAVAKTEMAEQQERAAKAELALLNLKNALKDRTIAPDQKAKLVKLLTGGPNGPIMIVWTSTDTDAFALARQIEDVLRSSGWNNVSVAQSMGTDAVGLSIAVHDYKTAPAYAVLVQRAFGSAGITLESQQYPNFPPEEVRILIGHKPKVTP